jgi:ketosteroid isomerase-like protein
MKISQYRRALILALVLLMSAGCVEKEKADSAMMNEQVQQSIRDQNEKFMETFVNGNMEAFSTVFIDESGKMMPPDQSAVTGRDSIMQFMHGMRNNGVSRIVLQTRELYPYTHHAVEVGNYQVYMDDTTRADRGKYMVYWKRSDGKWRIYRNIWNSDLTSATGIY